MKLEVLPQKESLEFQPGDNLLSVLIENDIPVSYSCRSGRCGLCRCRVVAGDLVERGGSEYRTLSRMPSSQVLSCQTTLNSDSRIEINEPQEVVRHLARILKGTVSKLENLSDSVKLLRLNIAKPLSFSPGQYVNILFSKENMRCYSIANLPDQGYLDFHIQIEKQGSTSDYIQNTLKIGDQVKVQGPLGTSYLRTTHTGSSLLVCSGAGLGPSLSILQGMLNASMANPVDLYVGFTSEKDLYGLDDLADLKKKFGALNITLAIVTERLSENHYMSEQSALQFHFGSVIDALAKHNMDLSKYNAYIFGGLAMTDAVSLHLKSRGLAAELMYVDAFYPALEN